MVRHRNSLPARPRLTRAAGVMLFFVVATAVFFLFAFNSGYGYDALEYLVIGRSLNDGYPLYAFIPSKSFGLYCFVAAYLRLVGWENHFVVTALISAIYSLLLVTTFAVVAPRLGLWGGLLASGLVGLCAAFMELNYLEPEGLVYVCGLMGFVHSGKALRQKKARHWFIAGLWIGAGCWFKVVSAFYSFGVAGFLFYCLLTSRMRLGNVLLASFLGALGIAAMLAIPCVYFAATGGLDDHLQWTYFYPLLHRPVDLSALSKLWTKLLWFSVLVVACILASAVPRIRKKVYAEPDMVLVLLMGLAGCLALFKTQASHYVFPGGALLAVFCTRVMLGVAPTFASPRFLVPAASAGAVLLLGSICLYQPAALARLLQLRDFSDEAALGTRIRSMVPDGASALCFRNSTRLYWISHTYPNVPFINFDVQTSHYLSQNRRTLRRAVRDSNLALVEFCAEYPAAQDRAFLDSDDRRRMLTEFHQILQRDFETTDLGSEPYCFWRRGHPSEILQ